MQRLPVILHINLSEVLTSYVYVYTFLFDIFLCKSLFIINLGNLDLEKKIVLYILYSLFILKLGIAAISLKLLGIGAIIAILAS